MPSIEIAVEMAFKRIAPAKTPVSFPIPPCRLTPPITTAAIASNSIPIPMPGKRPPALQVVFYYVQ